MSALTTEVQYAVLERLRVEWTAAYPEGRPRLGAPLVADLAWRMVQAKLQPTVEHIRTVQGGGSPNVIHPA